MKKCIMFVFLFMLFLLIGPEPKQIGTIRKEARLTIEVKDNVPEPSKMAINQIYEYVSEEISLVFVETVCERNITLPPVNFRHVVVKPKFRVQSARISLDDGNQIFA